jgi:ATP-binding cassette subfamily C protein LapB
MKSLIRNLSKEPQTAAMLFVSSFIIGICALAPSLFVIIVLNKYLSSGVTATLISLTIGAVLAMAFEFVFRQNRGSMMTGLNQRLYDPLLKAFTEKFRLAGQLTSQQYKKLDGAGTMIKNMRTSATTSWLLDWPFVLMFLIVLLYINWAAAIITAIFMVVMYNLVTWKRNMTMSQETQSNIEICLNGLQTIVIMAVGATMIIAGTLDIGLLIGSNILAARALQGTSKYAKAIEFSKQRDQAVGEIINYVKSK